VTRFVTVILGQQGGPSSSTSMTEALMVSCWSSTPLGSQVVRLRLSGGSQGIDLRLVGARCVCTTSLRGCSAGRGRR
jgi:hypothetical protein